MSLSAVEGHELVQHQQNTWTGAVAKQSRTCRARVENQKQQFDINLCKNVNFLAAVPTEDEKCFTPLLEGATAQKCFEPVCPKTQEASKHLLQTCGGPPRFAAPKAPPFASQICQIQQNLNHILKLRLRV